MTDFNDRYGFYRPEEAIDAVLDGANNLPDPARTIAAVAAMRMTAGRLADDLTQPFTLYSPQHAATFLAEAGGVLAALGGAIARIGDAVEAAVKRGDIPEASAQEIAEAKAETAALGHHIATWVDPLAVAGARFGALEYSGYTEHGDAAHVHAIAAELSRRGVVVGDVHEPKEAGEEDDEPGLVACIVFTYRGCEFALSDHLGWELSMCEPGGETCVDVPTRHAYSPAHHPTQIVDEALAGADAALGNAEGA